MKTLQPLAVAALATLAMLPISAASQDTTRVAAPVTVVGVLSHASGVATVEVGGTAAELQPLSDGSYRFSATIRLPQDSTRVEVVARAGNGELFSAVLTVDPATGAIVGDAGQAWSLQLGFSEFERNREQYRRLIDAVWWAPDSLVTVVGVPDTMAVRVGASVGDRFDPIHFEWSSSTPSVARVDARGVVYPAAPGSTVVTATAFNRSVSTRVRVLERPLEVIYRPIPEILELTRGERFRVAADLELPGGVIARDAAPRLVAADTTILDAQDRGLVVARRTGTTVLTAGVAGTSRSWTVRVTSPELRIRPAAGALPVGVRVPLRADYVHPDGGIIGEALAVTWTASGGGARVEEGSVLRTTAPGRTTLVARSGEVADTMATFALGDLVLALESEAGWSIETVSLDGLRAPLLTAPRALRSPAVSPDGTRIAFVGELDGSLPRLHVMNADGTDVRRVTPRMTGPLGLPIPFYQEHGPSWSADGARIYFTSNARGSYDVYSIQTNGSNLRRITRDSSLETEVHGAFDGPSIVFERWSSALDSDVWLALADGSESQNLTNAITRPSLTVWREGKPTLLPGGDRLLMVETPARYRTGESLVMIEVATRRKLASLVGPEEDREILYAVSPAGDRVAYHQRPRLGGGEPVVVVVDLDGELLGSATLSPGSRVVDVAWGAAPVAGVGR